MIKCEQLLSAKMENENRFQFSIPPTIPLPFSPANYTSVIVIYQDDVHKCLYP